MLPAIGAEQETRSVRAALSSTEPVSRPFGTEILRHEQGAVDLSRAQDAGLPLLINHDDKSLPIGRVRNIALEDGILRGDLHFSEATEAARDAWELARDGTLSDVSVRYRINDYEVRGDDEYHVTDWALLEASVVSVPADASVGIGRQMELEGIDMPKQDNEAPAAVPTPSASRKAGRDEGALAERERISGIHAVARNFADNATIQDLAAAAVDGGHSVDAFRAAALDALHPNQAEPLAAPVRHQTHQSVSIRAGEDGGEKALRAMQEAVDFRAGVDKADDAVSRARGNEYSGLSLVELARKHLELIGIDTRGMSPMDVAGAALGHGADIGARYIDPGTANLTTTNFPAILANSMNKALFQGFDEAPVTWNIWCGTDSAQDFKPGTRPGLSQFTSLAVVAENAAIADGIMNDKAEGFQIETYARKFSVTRQTLVNDDLAALANTANRMGQAAGRTVDEAVYTYLESNPTMTEVANLFAVGNGNQGSGAIDVANIGNARVDMGKQTDSNNIILGIVPQYMIAPLELEQTMLELSIQNTDPVRVRRDNVYRTLWTPVATPRLTDTNDWYMMAGQGDTINVVFLNGQQSPMMAQDEGWSTLAAHWRVVLDFDVMAVDYRGCWKSVNA